MSTSFATVNDITALWRPLTTAETAKAESLLPIVSDSLRVEAENRGYDLDSMIAQNPALGSVATSVTVDIVSRTLSLDTSAEPMEQVSQSALGYSWSGTYAVAGGGMQIMRNDLKRLGILKQRLGVIEIGHHRNHCANCEPH
jgi:hypothetical protein